VRMKILRGAIDDEDLLPQHLRSSNLLNIPRYARVNTLKTTTSDVIKSLEKDKFEVVPCAKNQAPKELNQFWLDDMVPDLLVFHPNGLSVGHRLVKESHLIFQDKASCLPAAVANIQPDWTVLDACAAPGNKTLHIAALLQKGQPKKKKRRKVIAFERDPKRFKTLCSRVDGMGAKGIVECTKVDFLSVNPSKFKDVDAIFLDPSCSGSGLRYQGGGGRLEHLLSQISKQEDEEEDIEKREEEELERARKLGAFQRRALRHAMKFPNVKKIVYSTCSIYRIENEDVVEAVLELEDNWGLLPVLPQWQPRGKGGIEALRAEPKINLCNGFFVSVLVKQQDKSSDYADEVVGVSEPEIVSGEEDKGEYFMCENKKRKFDPQDDSGSKGNPKKVKTV